MVSKKDAEIRISTMIGDGVALEGDFSAPGSVRIDGCVNGSVAVAGTLIIGASGVINGGVTADALIVGGEIVGNVDAGKRVELTGTAKVLGDITTSVVVIDENAIFQGRCNMNQNVPDRKVKAKAAKAVKESKKSAKAALAEALREVQEAENRERQESGAEQETAANTRQDGEETA